MDVDLTDPEIKEIGNRIFKNECAEKIAMLTSWNKGEDFASLGIGHFIWYPENKEGPFKESFVELISHMKKKGAELPLFIRNMVDLNCPWATREEFMGNIDSNEMKELRAFLFRTMDIQALFIIHRLDSSLTLILENTTCELREKVKNNYYAVAAFPDGLYVLADYINFKGRGILPSERYKGKGWGLKQVLEEMDEEKVKIDPIKEFAVTAERILIRRVENSPVKRGEKRWLKGWKNRINTYTNTSVGNTK